VDFRCKTCPNICLEGLKKPAKPLSGQSVFGLRFEPEEARRNELNLTLMFGATETEQGAPGVWGWCWVAGRNFWGRGRILKLLCRPPPM
jgi:hypothetical protein